MLRYPWMLAASVDQALAPPDPSVSRRILRQADRASVDQLAEIDSALSAWVGWQKTSAVDSLLDERLYRWTPDAMATWPRSPGRPA